MPNASKLGLLTVRLPQDVLKALKAYPKPFSPSVLVRVLLREFLSGRLPQVVDLILKEASDTEAAVKNGHEALQQWKLQNQSRGSKIA